MPIFLRIRSVFLTAAIASALPILTLAQLFAQAPVASTRIHGPIVDADVVTLFGNTHPLARPDFDLGALDSDASIGHMVLLLAPSAQQQTALDALTESQQAPDSASYHQWLTPAEYGSRFGASTEDISKVSAWLANHGFAVEPADAAHRSIVFSGTAAQVEDTFHATMHRYQVAGKRHIANAQDPQIPQALASVVTGIVSLHDFRRTAQISSQQAVSTPENTQGSNHYLFPADFATIYHLNPLYSAGTTGTGVTIAVVGRSNINLNDVQTFRSFAGLPANNPAIILAGPNPGIVTGDESEAALDTEWAGAIAPAAAVKLVVAASTSTTDGVDIAAQYIVNHKTAQVMSVSFGSCEANMGASELAFYNSLWQQAASEGITVLVSSDDSGVAGCSSASSSKGSGAGVNGLCSSPYSTCVGGTEFNETSSDWSTRNGAGNGSALSYIPEKVWNESASNGGSGLWSSGGGISRTYPQPSWQKGVSGANSNGMRAVPDVALTAAAHDGYLVALNGSWYVFSGTSASSPSFAGILALIVQQHGNAGLGNANPTLYGLLSASENPFHATPSGNNSVPGVQGFTASGAAYNLATGLGSVDASILAAVWPAAAKATKPTISITPATTSLKLVRSKAASLQIAITTNIPGPVTMSIKGLPKGVSATWKAATVTPAAGKATALLTLSADSSAALNSASFTITASATGVTANVPCALTILASTNASTHMP